MIRGTTPTVEIKINTPITFSDIEEVYFSFKSKTYSADVITKKYSLNEVILDGTNSVISTMLSQEDTLKIPNGYVGIQLRIYMTNGKAYATQILETDITEILEGGVIGGE